MHQMKLKLSHLMVVEVALEFTGSPMGVIVYMCLQFEMFLCFGQLYNYLNFQQDLLLYPSTTPCLE